MTMDTASRLSELGLTLPPASPSAGSYTQTVRAGDLVFTAGQIAVDGGNRLAVTGQLGAQVDVEAGIACARQCALNVLAQVQDALDGELDRVVRVVKLTVFVASAPGFTGQSVVANGASDLVNDVLGDAGVHSRSAVGVASLPLGSPVEVEAIVQVR